MAIEPQPDNPVHRHPHDSQVHRHPHDNHHQTVIPVRQPPTVVVAAVAAIAEAPAVVAEVDIAEAEVVVLAEAGAVAAEEDKKGKEEL